MLERNVLFATRSLFDALCTLYRYTGACTGATENAGRLDATMDETLLDRDTSIGRTYLSIRLPSGEKYPNERFMVNMFNTV